MTFNNAHLDSTDISGLLNALVICIDILIVKLPELTIAKQIRQKYFI